jgi:hypothetical protein
MPNFSTYDYYTITHYCGKPSLVRVNLSCKSTKVLNSYCPY